MNCTWVDCNKEAAHSELGKDGKEWCNLCDEHHQTLETSYKELDTRKILSYWVKAQGGARKITDKMQPEIEQAAKLMGKLVNGFGKFKANSKIDTSNW
jgi:hypothetical protein